MPQRKIIFFDLETSGLDRERHAIIEIGAVACTLPDLQIVDNVTFRVKFLADNADPVALAHNGYARQVSIPEGVLNTFLNRYEALTWEDKQKPEIVKSLLEPQEWNEFYQNHYLWQTGAMTPSEGAKFLSAFLKTHATVGKVSKAGKPYNVALLAGHNVAVFDMPFLQAWYSRLGVFLPAEYFPLDTLQMALGMKYLFGVDYPDLKLETLCRYHGVAEKQNHEALADVYMNVALMRVLHHRIYLTNEVSAVSESELIQGLPESMRVLMQQNSKE